MSPGRQSLYIGTSSTVLELEVAREEHAPSYRQPGGAHTRTAGGFAVSWSHKACIITGTRKSEQKRKKKKRKKLSNDDTHVKSISASSQKKNNCNCRHPTSLKQDSHMDITKTRRWILQTPPKQSTLQVLPLSRPKFYRVRLEWQPQEKKKINLFNNEAEILKQVMLNQIWKTTLTLPLAAPEQTSNLTPF